MKTLLIALLIAYNPIDLLRSPDLRFRYPTRIPTEFPDSSKRLTLDVKKNQERYYHIVIKQNGPCVLDGCIVGELIGTRRVLTKKGSTTTLKTGRTAFYLDCDGCLSSLTWVERGTNYQLSYFINEETRSDRLKILREMANSSLD